MERRRRTGLASGLVLILIGIVLLAFQVVPSLKNMFDLVFTWPLIVVAVAFGLLVLGLLTGAPEMAVPACIVGGIGGILYWQDATGNWESWSYLWTLIPGFVGIGITFSGLIKGKRNEILDGLQSIAVSVVLFLIFGSFFGVVPFGPYWPVLLIALGAWTLAQNLFRSRK